MKPLENRQKVDEDRKRREAEAQHPSTRGRLAPVVPIRPPSEKKQNLLHVADADGHELGMLDLDVTAAQRKRESDGEAS